MAPKTRKKSVTKQPKQTKNSNKENEPSKVNSKKKSTKKRVISSSSSSESSISFTPIKKIQPSITTTNKKSKQTVITDKQPDINTSESDEHIPDDTQPSTSASSITITRKKKKQKTQPDIDFTEHDDNQPTTSAATIEISQSQLLTQTSQKSEKFKTILKEILSNGKSKLFPKKIFTIGKFDFFCLLI